MHGWLESKVLLKLRAKFVFSMGLLGLLCLLAPGSLRAQTTYTYTGNPYYACNGAYTCSGTTPYLTVSFTTSMPRSQLANLNQGGSGLISASVTSYTVTDNSMVNITPSSNSANFYVDLSTDANGNPTNWTVYATAVDSPNYGNEGGCTTTTGISIDTGCNGRSWSGDESQLSNLDGSLYGEGEITFSPPYNRAPGKWVVTTTAPLQLSNQIFPLTLLGQSTTQTVTVNVLTTDTIEFQSGSFQLAPGSEYALNGQPNCMSGVFLTAGQSCTVSFTFKPVLPGQSSSPVPISRSTPLLVTYYDQTLSQEVTVNLALSGTASGPIGVFSPGVISDLVGNDASPQSGYGGDGGPASGAIFTTPAAITMDGLGNSYIADAGNSVVRVVYKGGAQIASLIALENPGTTAKVGYIYTVAGIAPNPINNGGAGTDGVLATQSALNNPVGVALDAAGNLYISDSNNLAVRMVNAVTGIINTVAGTLNNGGNPVSPGCCFSGDLGPATQAQLYYPSGITVDGNGNIFIADNGNNAVRVVYEGGTELANLIGVEIPGTTATVGEIYTIAGGPNNPAVPSYGDGGLASAANLNAPLSVAVDSAGDIYIADSLDLEVRRVDSVTGYINWVLQLATSPVNLAVDASDNIYTTLPSTCQVWKYSPYYYALNDWMVAGNGTCSPSGDGGAATLAGLDGAEDLVVDGAGNLYILEADGVRFVDGSQSSFAFGSQNIGLATAAQSVFLTDNDILNPENPQGYNPSVIYLQPENNPLLSIAAPFAVAPFTNPPTDQPNADCANAYWELAPGEACGISIYFLPLADGLFTANAIYDDSTYSVTNGFFTAQPIHLSGTGTGTFPTATLTGGPLTFTAVVNETTSPAQYLTLTNTSTTSPLAISQIYTSTFQFQETNNCGTTLAPNTSCTISVTFATNSTALVNGTLYVLDDASTGGGTQSASVSGTGTAPVAMLTTSGFPFGTLMAGATSGPGSVTIKNTGTAPLTFCTPTTCFAESGINPSAFTVTGNEPDQFAVNSSACGATLAIGASCTVTVTFTPSTSGAFSATLNVNDDSGGGLRTSYHTQTVVLSGTGSIAVGNSSFTIGNNTFPATAVGQSATQTVNLTLNNSLALQSIGIGSGYTEFSVGTITGCTVNGVTVNPGTTVCSIPVTFAPATAGLRTAPLVVVTIESGVPTPYSFPLTGIGTGPVAALTPGIISTYVGGSGGVATGIEGAGGPANQAAVGYVNGMALDAAGNLYLSDEENNVIWQVNTSGIINLYAGTPFPPGGYLQSLGGDGGPALGSTIAFGGPLAVDALGGLYLGDSQSLQGNSPSSSTTRIRYINPANGIITTVVGGGSSQWQSNTHFFPGSVIQIKVGSTNYLFDATQGGVSGSVEPTFPATPGQTVADGSVLWQNEGAGTNNGGVGCPSQTDSFGDGCVALQASVGTVGGMVLDQAGNLYFSDTGNIIPNSGPVTYHSMVRRVDAVTGIVTVVAGNGTQGHAGDGGLATATGTEVNAGDLVFDSGGNLYIQEPLDVRMVNATSGIITTITGQSTAIQGNCGSGDGGAASAAAFASLTGMAIDAANDLYLVDYSAGHVRRIDAGTQIINLVVGEAAFCGGNVDSGDLGFLGADGSAFEATLAEPLLVRLDGMGNMYIMQSSRGIRKVNVSESVLPFNGPYEGTNSQPIDTASGPLTATVLNAGNSGRVSFISPFTSSPWGISSTNFTRDVTNPTGVADCYDVGFILSGYECPVSVDFTPLVAGSLTGVNVVTDDAVNNPQTIQLTGIATGTPPSVTLLPFLLSFSEAQGGTSAPQTLTLTNNSGSPVSISGITITGSGATGFGQTNTCGTSLAANSSCFIYVTFNPPVVGGTFVNAPPPDILTALVTVTDAAGQQTSNLIGKGTLPVYQPPAPTPLNIVEIIHVTDAPTVVIPTPLTVVENIHLTDTLPAVTPSTLLNINETIHTTDTLSSVTPSTLLAINETIHTTDLLPAVTPSTLLSIAETIHTTDMLPSVTPSTLLGINETIHTTDNVSPSVEAQAIPTITWLAPSAITYGTPLGATQLDAASNAAGTFIYSPAGGTVLPPGVYTLSVTFTPSNPAAYTTASGSTTLTIAKANTSTTVVASPTTPSAGNSVTFTITVAPETSGTPTGTVTLYDGTTQLGIATLNNGVATFLTANLPDGANSITAVYAGDSDFLGDTSKALSEVVSDFTLASSTPPQTVLPGQNATFALTLTPIDGAYNNSITLSASGLPAGANAIFGPAILTPGGNTGTSNLTIQTTSQTAHALPLWPTSSKPAWLLAFLLPLLCMRRGRRSVKRSVMPRLVLAALTLGIAFGLSACGGSGGGTGIISPPPVTSVITITATSGAVQHSTTVSLTVQ